MQMWVTLFTAQHSTAQHSTAQHSTAQHSTAQHSTLSDYLTGITLSFFVKKLKRLKAYFAHSCMGEMRFLCFMD
ncbi:hypothetical protein A8806_108221 [Faecalicatena orotica]|uniref:Uncharacterized protein n=1 Tax=Faecalicatena orotica TaxID=1544 RepID=A0A2Y9BGB2_9FIRM|nr:hypothetical protein A8806_108221 [Faecalicatena orotica]SSA56528.1 hypothetical protein SAMN05216536_108221 [Faecalicatena orotica]